MSPPFADHPPPHGRVLIATPPLLAIAGRARLGCPRRSRRAEESREPMAQTHYFPTDSVHFTWDAGLDPVLEIDSGDTVIVETRDVSDNQIGPGATADVVAGLDW